MVGSVPSKEHHSQLVSLAQWWEWAQESGDGTAKPGAPPALEVVAAGRGSSPSVNPSFKLCPVPQCACQQSRLLKSQSVGCQSGNTAVLTAGRNTSFLAPVAPSVPSPLWC